MASTFEDFNKVIQEIFFHSGGEKSAIEKYSKVRITEYEIFLYLHHHLPLEEVSGKTKKYFSERFLKNKPIPNATKQELDEAFLRLLYAVGNPDHIKKACPQSPINGPTGCHKRCLELVKELNAILKSQNIEEVNAEKFLDWFTFDYTVKVDHEGKPVLDRHQEIRIFHNSENFKEFKKELMPYLKAKKIVSMRGIAKLVLIKRKIEKNAK